jgi:hypothetical protein
VPTPLVNIRLADEDRIELSARAEALGLSLSEALREGAWLYLAVKEAEQARQSSTATAGVALATEQIAA